LCGDLRGEQLEHQLRAELDLGDGASVVGLVGVGGPCRTGPLRLAPVGRGTLLRDGGRCARIRGIGTGRARRAAREEHGERQRQQRCRVARREPTEEIAGASRSLGFHGAMLGSITLPGKVTRDAVASSQMPELPEVEVVRRGLQAGLSRRVVSRVEVREPRLRWPVPEGLSRELAGRRLESVGRRGKYLLMDFGGATLIAHLGMSGNFRILEAPQAPARHDHVDIDFGERLLRYHDPRRFGAMLWHTPADGPVSAHPLLAGLGVEPFSDEFDGEMLYRATRGRAVAIKQLLLSGTVVVGV